MRRLEWPRESGLNPTLNATLSRFEFFLPEPLFDRVSNAELRLGVFFFGVLLGVLLPRNDIGVLGDLEDELFPEVCLVFGDFDPFELLRELAGVGGPGFWYTHPVFASLLVLLSAESLPESVLSQPCFLLRPLPGCCPLILITVSLLIVLSRKASSRNLEGL